MREALITSEHEADCVLCDCSSESTPKRGTPGKAARKWDDSGKVSKEDMASLDFSSGQPDAASGADIDALVDQAALGKRAKGGLYEVADYEDRRASSADSDDLLASLAQSKLAVGDAKTAAPAKQSALSSFFSRLTTTAGVSSKVLTREDLQPVLEAMRQHLMNKNVAQDIADKICDAVGQSLVGKTTSGFGDGGVQKEVRQAMESSLTRILTSKTSTDILLDITRKRQSSTATATVSGNSQNLDPYTITFVGVNGVGKSTNLSKVAFWLLQNRLKVLIAACDTFRSGAVEQLRTHVRNLGKLKVLGDDGVLSDEATAASRIELYERGYGKDAAGIAKDAIAYGESAGQVTVQRADDASCSQRKCLRCGANRHSWSYARQ